MCLISGHLNPELDQNSGARALFESSLPKIFLTIAPGAPFLNSFKGYPGRAPPKNLFNPEYVLTHLRKTCDFCEYKFLDFWILWAGAMF